MAGKKQAEKAVNKEAVAQGVDAQINALIERAMVAREKFLKLTQEDVDRVTKAMALAGQAAHMELARMAVEETGRGILEDKVTKNIFATEYVYHSIKYDKTVGVIEDNAGRRFHAGCRACRHCLWGYSGDQSDIHHHVQVYYFYQNP